MHNILIGNNIQIIEQVFPVFQNEEYMIDLPENCYNGYELALWNFPKLKICNKYLYQSDGHKALPRLKDGLNAYSILFIFLINKIQIKNYMEKSISVLIDNAFKFFSKRNSCYC